ncbi:hypothetical protein BDP81DRAFT_415165 [Colletotrichum phormii]|uniref:Uncharacterized protein n=1 Tax=Colletotrichum phormii TaxID=359342 RepID=A0AAJ0A1E4_9PEZI|nr:uncharacterized protein BDP81DRAFT_415165 [Colletotrichum phormii]KAK1654188.1 hypothetical protein BDP81DRAFT_415165 [Colletotrichum phormii]
MAPESVVETLAQHIPIGPLETYFPACHRVRQSMPAFLPLPCGFGISRSSCKHTCRHCREEPSQTYTSLPCPWTIFVLTLLSAVCKLTPLQKSAAEICNPFSVFICFHLTIVLESGLPATCHIHVWTYKGGTIKGVAYGYGYGYLLGPLSLG